MYHGKPCWFELSALRGKLPEAEAFYAKVFDWQITDAGAEGMDYHLARIGDAMVAGMMEIPEGAPQGMPYWLIYIDVDDADALVAKATAAGGVVLHGPADIPGTGRFAVLTDPQGAPFGVLQPEPMDPAPPADSGAFNQKKAGHGNWIELMSSDPVAGLAFYQDLFGWSKSTAMDMGEMGTYQLLSWQGGDIGAIMGLGNAPAPCWLPYFGVDGVDDAMGRIRDGGGTILHGPVEVPGGAFIAIAQDPQQGHFAIVGPKGGAA